MSPFMDRREFLQKFAATAALAMTSSCVSTEFDTALTPEQGARRPHILLLMLDQMRYPVHFPAGVTSADEFMQRFMPNTYRHLWKDGVKFANHQIAASACTPSRGVMLTGLYTQQTWMVTTITPAVTGELPATLDPAFPTYGRLLREAGYQTPYFGKFHVTEEYPLQPEGCQPGVVDYLEPWGFQSFLCPDPGGLQGQGAGGNGTLPSDEDIADLAIGYFSALTGSAPPVCATVSFMNPHDYEFFWCGTEPQTYADLFAQAGETPLVEYDTTIDQLDDPPPQGFPSVPSNWEHEDTLAANKPKAQTMFNEANQAIFSGAAFDPGQQDFELQDSPILGGLVKKGVAPYSYWQRGQDSYAQIIGLVDEQIGRVLDSIPQHVKDNLVVVFTSDHGDYVGSHGFLQNKVGTAYAEALRVPLVVRDFTGRFASAPDVVRTQLTSSVDLLRLLVDLGNNGSSDWMVGDLKTLYESRHDVLGVVRSPDAAGREFACFTGDEFVQRFLNFNASPTHILAAMQGQTKLVTYNFWVPQSTDIAALGREVEFYDHSTPGGLAELDNTPNDPRVPGQLDQLFDDLVPNEVRKPLPESLQAVQAQQEQTYISFASLLDSLSQNEELQNVHVSLGGGL